MGGIEFIFKSLNVMILNAKVRKIGVETALKRLYIKFFHDLLHFFKEMLCG